MRVIVSVTRLLLVTVRYTCWADEVRLVVEIYDDLHMVSEVDYDEVSEVGEADQ